MHNDGGNAVAYLKIFQSADLSALDLFSIFFVKYSMVQFPRWDRPFGSSDREETALGLGKVQQSISFIEEQLNVTNKSEHILFRNDVTTGNTGGGYCICEEAGSPNLAPIIHFACSLINILCA